ncbi:MAG: hypothetical protein ABIP36_04080 [Acidimicrobiales bacterium]
MVARLLGTVTVTPGSDPSCPSGASCTSLDVSCPGVAQRLGAVVASRPAQGPPRGLVVLFSGELGTGWWASSGTGADLLDLLAENHLATVQVRWTAGWLASAVGEQAGPAALACRPATVIQWVHDQIYGPLGVISPGAGSCGFCVTGNSGGASAVAYATTQYPVVGVDAVLPTSGPPHAAMVQGCLRRAGEEAYWYTESAARTIDLSYGYADGGPCAAHLASFAERWEADEVDTPGRELARGFRSHVIVGGLDTTHAPEHAAAYAQRIGATVEHAANMDHTIQQSVDGLKALRAALLA